MIAMRPTKLGLGSLRLLLSAITLSFALSSVACSSTPKKPPASALKQASSKNDIKSEEELRMEEPNHVAPPPAYGNKVVLAEDDTQGLATF